MNNQKKVSDAEKYIIFVNVYLQTDFKIV